MPLSRKSLENVKVQKKNFTSCQRSFPAWSCTRVCTITAYSETCERNLPTSARNFWDLSLSVDKHPKFPAPVSTSLPRLRPSPTRAPTVHLPASSNAPRRPHGGLCWCYIQRAWDYQGCWTPLSLRDVGFLWLQRCRDLRLACPRLQDLVPNGPPDTTPGSRGCQQHSTRLNKCHRAGLRLTQQIFESMNNVIAVAFVSSSRWSGLISIIVGRLLALHEIHLFLSLAKVAASITAVRADTMFTLRVPVLYFKNERLLAMFPQWSRSNVGVSNNSKLLKSFASVAHGIRYGQLRAPRCDLTYKRGNVSGSALSLGGIVLEIGFCWSDARREGLLLVAASCAWSSHHAEYFFTPPSGHLRLLCCLWHWVDPNNCNTHTQVDNSHQFDHADGLDWQKSLATSSSFSAMLRLGCVWFADDQTFRTILRNLNSSDGREPPPSITDRGKVTAVQKKMEGCSKKKCAGAEAILILQDQLTRSPSFRMSSSSFTRCLWKCTSTCCAFMALSCGRISSSSSRARTITHSSNSFSETRFCRFRRRHFMSFSGPRCARGYPPESEPLTHPRSSSSSVTPGMPRGCAPESEPLICGTEHATVCSTTCSWMRSWGRGSAIFALICGTKDARLCSTCLWMRSAISAFYVTRRTPLSAPPRWCVPKAEAEAPLQFTLWSVARGMPLSGPRCALGSAPEAEASASSWWRNWEFHPFPPQAVPQCNLEAKAESPPRVPPWLTGLWNPKSALRPLPCSTGTSTICSTTVSITTCDMGPSTICSFTRSWEMIWTTWADRWGQSSDKHLSAPPVTAWRASAAPANFNHTSGELFTEAPCVTPPRFPNSLRQ